MSELTKKEKHKSINLERNKGVNTMSDSNPLYCSLCGTDSGTMILLINKYIDYP